MNALLGLGYSFLKGKLSLEDQAVLGELQIAHQNLVVESAQVEELFEALEADFNITFDLDRLDVDENLEEIRIFRSQVQHVQAQTDAEALNRYLGLLHQCVDALGEDDLDALPANVKALVEARDDRDRYEAYLSAFRDVVSEHLGNLPSDTPLSHGELADAVIARLKSDRSIINDLVATAEGQKQAILQALCLANERRISKTTTELIVVDADSDWQHLHQALLSQIGNLKGLIEEFQSSQESLAHQAVELVRFRTALTALKNSDLVQEHVDILPADLAELVEHFRAKMGEIANLKARLREFERVGQGGEKPPAPVVIVAKVEPKKPAPASGRPKKQEAPPRVSLPSWNYVTSPEIMVEYVRVRANGMDHARACREANVEPAERTTVSANMATTVQRAKEYSGVEREEYLANLLERWRVRASIRRAA